MMISQLKLKVFFAVGIYLSSMQIVLARHITPLDAPLQINYNIEHIYINKDGSSRRIRESEFTLLKEHTKQLFAHFPIEYNKTINTLKVLKAGTMINNKIYPVNLKYIEDKPIASNAQSFDQINRVTISYPKLELNAKVFFKTQETIKKSVVENLYYRIWGLDKNVHVQSDIKHIVSELPLYVEKNDPNDLIEIVQHTKKEKNKTLYFIDIKQKRSFIQGVVDEYDPMLNPKDMLYVCISSLNNWSDFGASLSKDYDKIKQEKLPPLYQEIANIAKLQKTPIQKINTVTSLLADKINYLTDCRTIKGRMIPQPLHIVAKTQLGDCKDFSMATSVILKSIGIPSKIALVQREEKFLPLPLKLVNPGFFNHAIVKVELTNETLWIDPTNFQSMATPVFSDIANRQAIVLDGHGSKLEMIPVIDPKSNTFSIKEKWSMKNPEIVDVEGLIKITGLYAQEFTGLQKITSNESIKSLIIETINENYGHILEKEIILPDLNSRIVNDLFFHYKIKTRSLGVQTNSGVAIPIVFNYLGKFNTKKDTVSDIYLGPPKIVDLHTTIDHIYPIGKKSLDFHIDSPWVNFIRTVEYKDNHIIVHQKMELKKSWLTAKELQSVEYQTLALALDKNVNKGIVLIVESQR